MDESLKKKRDLCEKIYVLLKDICYDNLENKKEAAYFMGIYATQSIYIPSAMDFILID